MTARMRPITLAFTLVSAASLVLGGCANRKATLADLEAENQELRDRNALVEQALNDAEARNAALQSENSDLRNQLASGPIDSGSTGFEGTGAQVSTRNQDIVVTVAGDVLFASGSADLRQNAKATLDQIAGVLTSSYAGQRIEIAGHTDTDPMRKTKGKWQDNENLSAQRALAVERYLGSRGVNRDLMHISGFGPAQPRGSKQDSRRVEIIVLASGF